MTKAMNYTVVALLAVALVLAAASVYAGGPKNKATGTVTWSARTHLPPSEQITGIISDFNAHDVGSGMDDKGSHTLSRPADTEFTGGELTMDVKCVRVNGNEAWFAGPVVEASGGYSDSVGDVFLYWVKDATTPGEEGDEIGGTGKYATLAAACTAVEGEDWKGTGDVTDGNLMTHYWD